MARETEIAWTDSTFNASMPEAFAAFHLALVPDTGRLEMAQFVAWMTKRRPIVHIESKFWELAHWFFMVRSKVSSTCVTTIPATIVITLENVITPDNVFRLSTQIQVALAATMRKSVVIWSALSTFAHYCANTRFGFSRLLFPDSIRRMTLCRFAHSTAGFVGMFPPLKCGRFVFFEE